MSNILNITTRKEERSTLRVLTIIEGRGFDVVSLNLAEPTADTHEMRVQVKNRYDGFSAETLVRQLNKAHGVIQATLETFKPTSPKTVPSQPLKMCGSPATYTPQEVGAHSNHVETVR